MSFGQYKSCGYELSVEKYGSCVLDSRFVFKLLLELCV